MKRRAAVWIINHLTLSAGILLVTGPILAAPFIFVMWNQMLGSAVRDAEIRSEQRGRDKQVIVTLSRIDKNCITWSENNDHWLCTQR